MSYPEINGKPAAYVTVSVEDKINTGNYENVTVRYEASRFVEDDDKVISETHKHLAEEVCEPGLADQRQQILESIQS